MPEFVHACRAEDIPPGTAKEIPIGETPVAVFNIDGTFYACDDRCPHSGFSLAEGDIETCTVTCFGHGWSFDLRTGACAQIPTSRVTLFATKVVDGDVCVAVPDS